MRGQGVRRCLWAQENALTLLGPGVRKVSEGADSRVRLKGQRPWACSRSNTRFRIMTLMCVTATVSVIVCSRRHSIVRKQNLYWSCSLATDTEPCHSWVTGSLCSNEVTLGGLPGEDWSLSRQRDDWKLGMYSPAPHFLAEGEGLRWSHPINSNEGKEHGNLQFTSKALKKLGHILLVTVPCSAGSPVGRSPSLRT